jgi:hypothetical protein
MDVRRMRIAVLAALLVVGCGGGEAVTITSAAADVASTTTTVATTAATTDAGEETASLEELPEECVGFYVKYLQAIEPVAGGFDFVNATWREFFDGLDGDFGYRQG